jgi:CheY-like chemotaxis protein
VQAAVEILEHVNAAVALLLAGVAGLRARRGVQPERWGAAAFAALGVTLLIAALDADSRVDWVSKGLVCVLLAFPYLLLRFTASLGATPVRFLRPATAATAGILVAAVGVGEGAGNLAVQGLLLVTLVLFAVGFAPPRIVRVMWRLPELPAMTGGLGLELAREHRPDLILLDRHLPDRNGSDVLHRLKADPETRTIPVVIVSADATPGQIRRMRALGADDYVTKPLDVARFARLLDGIREPEEPPS